MLLNETKEAGTVLSGERDTECFSLAVPLPVTGVRRGIDAVGLNLFPFEILDWQHMGWTCTHQTPDREVGSAIAIERQA